MGEYEEGHEESGGDTRCRKFGRFIWNGQTKEFFGRTGKSWALIGLFYVIFYSCLAGFFVSMLAIFLNCVIENNVPKLTGMQSLLKLNPGISFFPLPDYKSTLVRYQVSKNVSYEAFTADIGARMAKIERIMNKDGARFATCNLTSDTKDPNDPFKTCKFDSTVLGTCNAKNKYGYADGQPCIFIKMNKVYGWIPDVKDVKNPYVTCEGETPADRENIGPLEYFPQMDVKGKPAAKISNVFFPYLKQNGYVSPVAAIRFTKPQRNVLIMVNCNLLGMNEKEPLTVRLELLVED